MGEGGVASYDEWRDNFSVGIFSSSEFLVDEYYIPYIIGLASKKKILNAYEEEEDSWRIAGGNDLRFYKMEFWIGIMESPSSCLFKRSCINASFFFFFFWPTNPHQIFFSIFLAKKPHLIFAKSVQCFLSLPSFFSWKQFFLPETLFKLPATFLS